MATSALDVTKSSRTLGSDSENDVRICTRGKGAQEAGWWLGGGEDDIVGDSLRHHLLPDLNLPIPPTSCLHSDPEPGRHTLTALHASDFFPSVLDDQGELRCARPDQPCTKRELQRAVSALVALNRAQSENIRTLSREWSFRHREMRETINKLESSLRLHRNVLVSIVDNMQRGRIPPAYWTELQAIVRNLHRQQNMGCSSSYDDLDAAKDQEATLEANDILSAAPAHWTSKLFDWSSRVDDLPIATVGVRRCVRTAAANAGSDPSSEVFSDTENSCHASDTDELQDCEGQGLRVHVMGSGGLPMSPAASRDAQRFRDFIGNASLRQEAWMETFSSFAATAAPVGALAHAGSLKLQLLDGAVTLPATDLLLLVAESLEPLGSPPLKAGMRVLCLLERSVAARCSVRSGSLRKGVPVDVHEFEPFCVCVQPNYDDTNSSNSNNGNRKVLTVPVCSLQGIKLARRARAPSDDGGSSSDSDTAGSHHTGKSRDPPAGGTKDNSNNTPGNVSNNGSSRGGGNSEGCVTAVTSTDAHGTPGRWISTAKRRKMHEEAVQIEDENRSGQLRQETTEQPQERVAGRDGQGHVQPQTQQAECCQAAAQSGEALANSHIGSVVQAQNTNQTHNSRQDLSDITSTSEGDVREPRPVSSSCPQDGSTRQVNANRGATETSAISTKASHQEGLSSTADTTATTESCRRTGMTTSVRCSGQAAQKQLEHIRQHLPRVRAVLPRQMRQQLPAFDCDECSSFFGMMGKMMPSDICCRQGQQSSEGAGKCNSGSERQRACASAVCQERIWSRHRQFAPPPSTPPGYWDL